MLGDCWTDLLHHLYRGSLSILPLFCISRCSHTCRNSDSACMVMSSFTIFLLVQSISRHCAVEEFHEPDIKEQAVRSNSSNRCATALVWFVAPIARSVTLVYFLYPRSCNHTIARALGARIGKTAFDQCMRTVWRDPRLYLHVGFQIAQIYHRVVCINKFLYRLTTQ